MRPKRNLFQPFTTRKPGRNTSRPIPGELRLTAIRIEQSQKKLTIRPPFQKLNPICANTGVSRTQLTRQLCVTSSREPVFNNQKVIPARMRFYKWNHSLLFPWIAKYGDPVCREAGSQL